MGFHETAINFILEELVYILNFDTTNMFKALYIKYPLLNPILQSTSWQT